MFPASSQHTSSARATLAALTALALALSGSAAEAQLSPAWTARLPVGASLSAGLQGLVVDAAGVSYVTGTAGPSSNTDVVTAAFGPGGVLLWSRTYNGPEDWHDQARGLAFGPGGVLWVTGNTPGPGMYANVLLLEYEASSGALLNEVRTSSGPFLSEHGASVATDAQGNVYVGGGTVGDGGDALVLKFDAAGVLQWTRVWDGPAFAPYSQDSVQQIRVDPSGDPVAMIHGVMGSLHPDYVVLKLQPSDGTTTWETIWGVQGGDFARDMEIDALGDVYVTGTGLDFTDKFSTIKLRGSDGQLLWQEYDSAGIDDAAAALALDGRGGVYVTGSVDPDGDRSNLNDNFYTVKRDAGTGELRWTHLYGANCLRCFDVPADVIVDVAGNVFVAGSTSSPPYSADMITLVLDSDTGLETERGIVSGGASESVWSGFLRFDAAYDLFSGGHTYEANTGAVEISVVKYASLAGSPYELGLTNLVAGSSATFSLAHATPLATQYVAFSLQGAGSVWIAELGVTLGIAHPFLLTSGPADGAGSFTAVIPVPYGAAGIPVWFQAAELDRITPVLARTVQ